MATTHRIDNSSVNVTCCLQPVYGDLLTIVHILFLVVFSIAGIVGNILVITAVITTPRLHIIANLFVVNLSVTDFCVCGFFEPMYMYTLYYNTWPHVDTWCQIIGFFTIATFGVSITTLSTIAINRYVLITRPPGTYRKVFSRRNNYIWVGWTWVFSIVWTLLPVMGFGKLGFNSAIGYCAYIYGDELTWWFLCSVLAFAVLPCVVMMFIGYFLTFRAIRLSRQRVQAVAQNGIQANNTSNSTEGTTTNKNDGKWSNTELKVTRQLFFIFAVFCVCWIPYCFANLSDRYLIVPKEAHRTFAALAWFNSSLNPYLYAWMNRNFRSAYKRLLCCKKLNQSSKETEQRTAGSTGTDPV
ncbi:5-hydroxytryptamine receptor 4-like [Saccoglossus kowalevskii]|uniref:G-protein coupled receptor 84-like n=1 Tax=Saccoglossus kowalevskii TaxID=10224 RepID=A0ABM0MFD8_SACKO|nr:PREDICTED: G-protein coupled receptor 84-like [Saccoglossus kowalevskii]